jgi:hypothetical protein
MDPTQEPLSRIRIQPGVLPAIKAFHKSRPDRPRSAVIMLSELVKKKEKREKFWRTRAPI